MQKLVNESLDAFLNEEYSEENLKKDFLEYAKSAKLNKRKGKKLWQKVYSEWYRKQIHSLEDLNVIVKRLSESLNEIELD